jgi:hypothetical protein
MIRSVRRPVAARRRASVGPGLVVLLVVLAAAGGVAAAVVGWHAGHLATSPAPVVPGDSRAVIFGPAHLTVPSAWTPVKPASARVAGLDPSLELAFAILPGLPAYALVTVAAPTDRSLIPSPLRRVLKAAPGTPLPTELAGRRAWSYLSVATWREQLMDITVVPTGAGVLAVACVGSRPIYTAVARCDQEVQSITVPGAGVLAPAPELAFRLLGGAAFERLRRERDLGYRALRAARTRGAQARALQAVATAYAGAAGRLAPVVPGNAAAAGLVAAMRGAARAYRVAGAAAAAGASRRYGAGRAAVRTAEARVAGTLDRVTRGGG